MFIFLLLISQFGFAHTFGEDPWCLTMSPFHKECLYKDENKCIQDLKRDPIVNKTNDTEPIPYDFKRFCEPKENLPSFF